MSAPPSASLYLFESPLTCLTCRRYDTTLADACIALSQRWIKVRPVFIISIIIISIYCLLLFLMSSPGHGAGPEQLPGVGHEAAVVSSGHRVPVSAASGGNTAELQHYDVIPLIPPSMLCIDFLSVPEGCAASDSREEDAGSLRSEREQER